MGAWCYDDIRDGDKRVIVLSRSFSTYDVCDRPSRTITPQSLRERVLGAWDASMACTACPALTVMLLSKVLIDRMLLWTPWCLLESYADSGVGNMVYFWLHSCAEIKFLLKFYFWLCNLSLWADLFYAMHRIHIASLLKNICWT